MKCIFCEIVSGEMPGQIVLRNEHICAFRDIHPRAPKHVLIVPNKHLASTEELSRNDSNIAAELLLAVKEVAQLEGISETGYRIISNCGSHGRQEVSHLHIHVLGGAPMRHGLG
jgi:histidine triad (HIT) family protein